MSEIPDAFEPPLSAPDEVAEAKWNRRWNRFYKIAAIWLLGWVGFIVYKIVSLDHLKNGLDWIIKGVISASLLLVITVPLAWLGSRIGKRERWRRYRLLLTFALPALFLLMAVGGALKGRYFPQERFKRLTGVEFPRDARVERCVFDDGFGPLFDWYFLCELTCPAGETDRVIRELKLVEIPPYREPDADEGPPGGGSTGPSRWVNGESEKILIRMEADAARTKLRISCFSNRRPYVCGVSG